MKKFIKLLFSICLLFSSISLLAVGYFDNIIGDTYNVVKGSELIIDNTYNIVSARSENLISVGKNGTQSIGGHRANISIFGIIPIKTVSVIEVKSIEICVLGTPFGIKMFTEGVLVVGYSDIDTDDGVKNPSKDAGIRKGDTILKINGKDVQNNSDVQNIIRSTNGKAIDVLIKRNESQFSVKLTPIYSNTDKVYKIGIWIRDSSAGIGTLTYYDPETNVVAGLGHGICDTDTGELVPCESGQFVGAEIVGIKKSSKDVTGELQGVFSGGVTAEIACNEMTGVFGFANKPIASANTMEIALKQEIKQGKAQILTTLDGGQPQYYDCVIKKVYHNDSSKIKNMVIEVTDPDLIAKTGGIVQGMSGSPIIQNGKLVGAVTHVLVDDPTRGYAIFAENMLETAQQVADEKALKDAS